MLALLVTLGTLAPQDDAVVALVHQSGELRCSGTLIAPQIVLTAAHCGIDAHDYWDYRVFIGSQAGGSGVSIDVVDARVHPAFDPQTFANDLALLFLREPAPVAPKPLSTGTPILDASARVAGYGRTSAVTDDAGTRRQGIASIADVSASEVQVAPSPSLPCVYDSGGAIFVTSGDVEYLLATISRGDAECSSLAHAVRVDAYTDFIAGYFDDTAPGRKTLGQRCLYDAHCASGTCLAAPDEPRIRYCSQSCSGDWECGALSCIEGQCRYPLPTAGAPGAACASQSDCFDTECTTHVCAPACSLAAPSCPSGLACTSIENLRWSCLPSAPAELQAAACSVGSTNPPSQPWILLLLVLLRRRPRT